MGYPRIVLNGDSAVCVEFGNEISIEVNNKVSSFQKIIEEEMSAGHLKGVVETIPAFCSIMICYDPEVIWYEDLEASLRGLLDRELPAAAGGSRRLVEIPVCYGGELGPDLKDVAEHAGITEEEVIKLHSGRNYLIYMMGFLPGFAYLGGLDSRLEIPRLPSPRGRIPSGSVGIGGKQTGIYPIDSPGGWRIIGKTPVRPFRLRRKNPLLYQTGDYIRFVPVSRGEYEQIKRDLSIGLYKCRVSEVEVQGWE